MSKALASKLSTQNLPEAGAAAQIAKLVNESIQLTRSISRGLSPVEFKPDDLNARQGLGLHTMRYRAGVIGGKLDIRGREGGGAVVECVLPLPQRAPTLRTIPD